MNKFEVITVRCGADDEKIQITTKTKFITESKVKNLEVMIDAHVKEFWTKWY